MVPKLKFNFGGFKYCNKQTVNNFITICAAWTQSINTALHLKLICLRPCATTWGFCWVRVVYRIGFGRHTTEIGPHCLRRKPRNLCSTAEVFKAGGGPPKGDSCGKQFHGRLNDIKQQY